MSTDAGYRFVDGVLTMHHRYWFANRGWLACECGKPLKDVTGRGIHMPEGIAGADAAHKRHTDREVGCNICGRPVPDAEPHICLATDRETGVPDASAVESQRTHDKETDR